ncbi:hypothetical protein [Paenibacillus sp. J14]|uniref:hypothetical protein n=1 Tax=Paenibacillus sp. (strain J14) TaxID=935845 RepID=UPI0004B801EA|nr:hypothetical protein [Paenibacillus sp. J14]
MILSEYRLYLKKYKFLVLIMYLQITVFLILFGTFVAFLQQLDYESRSLGEIYEGKAVYQLLDNYYDGEKYQDFNSQSDYLIKLKNYYSMLNTSTDFQYLAMFNHHILLEDKGLPLKFVEGYESGGEKHQESINGTVYTAVKSFQMNKKAADFFHLNTSEGTMWGEDDFSNSTNTMSVLLGSSYRKIYQLGEEISIKYYNKPQRVKVIGFLKENSKLFFNNNPEFYLDDYIIIPYREYGNPKSEEDELFQQINYFAMINGFIVTENNTVQTQKMFQRIDAIAKQNAIDYSFIGLNPHFLKYRGLLTTLLENKSLVQSFFFAMIFLNLLIISYIIILQQKRRFPFLFIHFINGATKMELIKMQFLEIGSVFLAAYLSAFIIIDQVLKLGDLKTQFILLLLSIAMSVISCIVPAYKLLYTPFVINHEEEGGRGQNAY